MEYSGNYLAGMMSRTRRENEFNWASKRRKVKTVATVTLYRCNVTLRDAVRASRWTSTTLLFLTKSQFQRNGQKTSLERLEWSSAALVSTSQPSHWSPIDHRHLHRLNLASLHGKASNPCTRGWKASSAPAQLSVRLEASPTRSRHVIKPPRPVEIRPTGT